MGVQITELLPKQATSLEEFTGKVIAIDASNHLYQFLTTIRSPTGALFTDSKGNVTSHLIGLFTRTVHLMKLGIKPAYVLDGEPPLLKRQEIQRRATLKQEATAKYEAAQQEGDAEGMRMYAARSTRLTREMIADAKEVVKALGLPVVQAPGEGEAQAAHIVKSSRAFAVASQDADSLLFGATMVVRNLSIEGRRKKAGVIGYDHVPPESIELSRVLSSLGISHEQLICLAMLVGTDYNRGGIKGIGPRNALKLVKQHQSPEAIFSAAKWQEHFDYGWGEVFSLLANPKITEQYELEFSRPDKEALFRILCDQHDFARQRVEKAIEELEMATKAKQQRGLGDFIG